MKTKKNYTKLDKQFYPEGVKTETNNKPTKEQIIELLINEIKANISHDITVLDDLLNRLPKKVLINALSDSGLNELGIHLNDINK